MRTPCTIESAHPSCRSEAPPTRNLPSVIGLWFGARATGSPGHWRASRAGHV